MTPPPVRPLTADETAHARALAASAADRIRFDGDEVVDPLNFWVRVLADGDIPIGRLGTLGASASAAVRREAARLLLIDEPQPLTDGEDISGAARRLYRLVLDAHVSGSVTASYRAGLVDAYRAALDVLPGSASDILLLDLLGMDVAVERERLANI